MPAQPPQQDDTAQPKGPRTRTPLDRDPRPPRREVITSVQGRVLDPATALQVDGVDVRPTVYVEPRLVLSKSIDVDGAMKVLQDVAEQLGWTAELDPEDPRTARLRFGLRTVSLGLASGRTTTAPDGWVLLQQTRAQFGVAAVRGVGLDHVVQPAIDPNPMHSVNPMHSGNPMHYGQPDALGERGPNAVAHLSPGRGGRAAAGGFRGRAAAPHARRRDDRPPAGRRGARHRVRPTPVAPTGRSAPTSPWTACRSVPRTPRSTSRAGATSPAGSTAVSTSWPATAPSSPVWCTRRARTPTSSPGRSSRPRVNVWESELVTALAQIAELVRRHRHGEPGGHPIDVLNLSMGYYHETPEDGLFDAHDADDPRRPRTQRRRGGHLGRQRRHQPSGLPGGLHALERRHERGARGRRRAGGLGWAL